MHTILLLLSLVSQIATTPSLSHNARQEPAPPNPTSKPQPLPPNPPATSTDLFSAPAANLISSYIPSSVTSLMYAHYTSYASTTGDPASIIESAFTALTPPAWLDTLPSIYQSNIEALESAISVLRKEPGATFVVPSPSAEETSTAAPEETGSGSGSVTGSQSTTSGDSMTGTSTATGRSMATESSSLQGVLIPVKPTPTFDWGPTESSGLAKATDVPIKAIGVIGFIGAVLVL